MGLGTAGPPSAVGATQGRPQPGQGQQQRQQPDPRGQQVSLASKDGAFLTQTI